MIHTVTLNPSLDYVMRLNSLDSGINKSLGEEIFFGGKGVNVSVLLARLGAQTTAHIIAGGFSGEKLRSLLEDEGVKTNFIALKNGSTRINVKLLADKQYDINCDGPDISHLEIEALKESLKMINDGDFLVLAGSVPKSLSDDIYDEILSSISTSGVKLVIDTTGERLMQCLKFKPFLIKPNHHELGEIFKCEISSENTDRIIYCAGELQKAGAKNVLVSRGKHGATLICENGEVLHTGIVPGKIVSNVGCGDSMVAGFIAGYLEKSDLSYAMQLGSAAGNATAFSSSLATRNNIYEILNTHFS